MLYSSPVSVSQWPSHVIIWGKTTSEKSILLGERNHPRLWKQDDTKLVIPLDSMQLVTEVTLTVYNTDFEGNFAHYYGAVELLSQLKPFCIKDPPFKQTLADEYAIASVSSHEEKGYVIRYCYKMTNDTNPLDVFGKWDPPIRHTVSKIPNRGYAFNEFVLFISGMNVDTGILYSPYDLEEVYQWIFEMEKVDVKSIRVFRIEDGSSGSTARINVFIQVTSKVRVADQIQRIVDNTPVVVLNKLIELDSRRYPTSISVVLNGRSTIITRPKETWEIVVECVCIVGTLGLLSLVMWVYRKAISNGYKRVCNAYRMRRRQVVFEEYGLPYDMWFNPIEIANETTLKSFETPYGEIHLVEPLVTCSEKKLEGFVVAEEL